MESEELKVRAHFQNGVCVPDEPISVPENASILLTIKVLSDMPPAIPSEGLGAYRLRHYANVIGSVTDMPEDASVQHDHYIYGTPKR